MTVEGGETVSNFKDDPIRASWQPGKSKNNTKPTNYKVAYTILPPDLKEVFTMKGGISISMITDEDGEPIVAIPSRMKLAFYEQGDNLLETSDKMPSILFLLDYNHKKIDKKRLAEFLMEGEVPMTIAEFGSKFLGGHNKTDRLAMTNSDPFRFPENLRKMN